MTDSAPDELCPNCLTCRQHFEDNGAWMMSGALKRAPVTNPAQAAWDDVARQMRDYHERHLPDDN